MCWRVQRVHVSSVLKDGVVSDMVWEGRGGKVYFGDDQGRVAVSHLPKVSSSDLAYSAYFI